MKNGSLFAFSPCFSIPHCSADMSERIEENQQLAGGPLFGISLCFLSLQCLFLCACDYHSTALRNGRAEGRRHCAFFSTSLGEKSSCV